MRFRIKPAQLTSATPFPYIQNRVLPLFCDWLQPTLEAVFLAKREQLKKLPICPVMVEAIKNKRPPSFPSPGVTLVSAADPLIAFLQAPLPFSATDCSPIRRASQLFSAPSPESVAKYADFKHRALGLLGKILSAEVQLAALDGLVVEGPSTEHKANLRSLSNWSVFLKVNLELQFKDVLKTVTLLHLQLRHEALDKQYSGSVYNPPHGSGTVHRPSAVSSD